MKRLSSMLIVLTVALFFGVTVINNVTAYQKTLVFMQHTLSMDSTSQAPVFMWRAVTNVVFQQAALVAIIVLQATIALLSLWSLCLMVGHRKADIMTFKEAKAPAILGCSLGFFLYAAGFLTVAGQWFMMRESTAWNVQPSVHAFLTLLGVSLICLYLSE